MYFFPLHIKVYIYALHAEKSMNNFPVVNICIPVIFVASSHQTSPSTVMCLHCAPHSSTALLKTAELCIIPWLPVWLMVRGQVKGLATAWINTWGPPKPLRHTIWWGTEACCLQRVSQSISYIGLNWAATDLDVKIPERLNQTQGQRRSTGNSLH